MMNRIAGSHTAAASTAAILHLLVKHQNVYKKLMEELIALGEGEVPTYEQLKDLPYLQATITEGYVSPLAKERELINPRTSACVTTERTQSDFHESSRREGSSGKINTFPQGRVLLHQSFEPPLMKYPG